MTKAFGNQQNAQRKEPEDQRPHMKRKNKKFNGKKVRCELHKTFFSKCHRDKIISQGLSVYVELSTGNQEETFLETCHENPQSLFLTLLLQVITFCDQIIRSKTKNNS